MQVALQVGGLFSFSEPAQPAECSPERTEERADLKQ